MCCTRLAENAGPKKSVIYRVRLDSRVDAAEKNFANRPSLVHSNMYVIGILCPCKCKHVEIVKVRFKSIGRKCVQCKRVLLHGTIAQ